MKTLVTAFIVIFLVGGWFGCTYKGLKAATEGDVSFVLRNNTEYLAIYLVYWIDHTHRDIYPEPWNIAGGELEPGEETMLEYSYPPGTFCVDWRLYREGSRIEPIFKRRYVYNTSVGKTITSTPRKE